MLKFNEAAFEEAMGMTPEEAIEAYDVDVSELESVANAVSSGKFAWSDSPVSYFGSNGMVFEGEFSPLDTPELRNSYLLIAFCEAGGLEVVDSKDDMGYIARWDVEPLKQLKSTMSETFVSDLGVDVSPVHEGNDPNGQQK